MGVRSDRRTLELLAFRSRRQDDVGLSTPPHKRDRRPRPSHDPLQQLLLNMLARSWHIAISLSCGIILGAILYLGSSRFFSSEEVPLTGRDQRQPVKAKAYVHRVAPAQADEWREEREEQALLRPSNTGQRLEFAPRDPEE